MAKVIMIQGTMSNAGKSILTTALCRIFKQDGYKVSPFKSQNMALNSYITKDGLEMGRAQAVQAEAAGVEPSVLMNPILLKPTTDMGSQVILKGEVYGNMPASEYFKSKAKFAVEIMDAFNELAKANDIIVIEGAGSPAEINLKSQDIVNMGMAKMANAPVLLAGDIDRGGVFAQLYGTIALLEKDERAMIKGLIINKFRGDKAILQPGIDMFKEKIKDFAEIDIVGVVPYVSVDIEDEDSLSDRIKTSNFTKQIDIAVIKMPKISNFTDLNTFDRFENVSLRYVTAPKELKNPDLIVLPGTKSTIADLLWMRQNGLEAAIKKLHNQGTTVFGICGGFQMLGENLCDPYGVEGGGEVFGMSLLPVQTIFEKEKTRTQQTGVISDVKGIFETLNGLEYSGYEIHMGKTSNTENQTIVGHNNTYGTYIHGIFDVGDIATTIINSLCTKKGVEPLTAEKFDEKKYKEDQYDKLADEVRKSLDMQMIYKILNEGI